LNFLNLEVDPYKAPRKPFVSSFFSLFLLISSSNNKPITNEANEFGIEPNKAHATTPSKIVAPTMVD
jgi:hypothetical protein